MAISTSGLYGLTLQKMFMDTAAKDLDSETVNWVLMVTDAYTPAFDTHDFRADITNEVTAGSGYTTGGQIGAGCTTTVPSPAAGQIKYDWTTDPAWTSSTITDAMAAVLYFSSGSGSGSDQLTFLSDFVTAATSSNGTFTIQIAANGWWYIDYVPA